ncbi:Putative sugar transporter, major facilitator superfamily, MFS transporter superfamily [Septoria linicola]|uniref:Sugar transporter, major facilitator superfamily, MFS transporter superfamily n=1 Tax=Septoria linicola TaxID=215465 RepID=A0A9Q9B1S1_9PEZI|nr:Putative sugar transporter, major facilitator superfamily, MFS transporter superfamily [Septoria linicola]
MTLEKSLAQDVAPGDGERRREEVEDGVYDDDRDPRSITRQYTESSSRNGQLAAPLKLERSRSSARSQRSYHLQDGYTIDADDDDDDHKEMRKQKEVDGSPDSEKDFEVQFDGEDDPYNPKNHANWRKWVIVCIVSSSSLCVTCASAMYTSTYRQLETEFHVSRLAATVGLTTFVCGLGLGPMFLSPLSEFYGRRIIYICAFGMYLVWLVPCAVAPNIATMLIARFFDGLAGSAFLSVAGGTVGDMFRRDQLSAPMMIYTASPFVGPEVGPVVGGFINQYTDWRWTFYVLIIWAGIQWLMIVLFVPETYAPVLLRRKAEKLRQDTGDQRYKAPIEIMDRSVVQTVLWSCIRPFQLLFFEQMCLNLCLLSAILLGILYLFFGAFAVVFQNNHGFNEWQTGLTFLGIFVGMLLGVSCDPLWRRRYIRLVEQNNGISEPEFRLPPTILGAIIVPISLFGFGWTTYSHVHWIVPIIFSVFFGLGNIFCFSGIFTFLVETYPLYAASALAANSFARSSFAAGFPLFGVQMYEKLGYQWASSVLALIALAMTPFPVLFFKKGKKLRANSRFANPKQA